MQAARSSTCYPQVVEAMPKIAIGPMDVRLGAYIRECREGRHLTQSMIAQVLDIDQQQFSRYEKGTNRVSLHLGVILADVFGQSVDQFVSTSNLFGNATQQLGEPHRPYRSEADVLLILNLLRLPDVIDQTMALSYFNRLKHRAGVRRKGALVKGLVDLSEIPDPRFQQYFRDYFGALERYSTDRLPG